MDRLLFLDTETGGLDPQKHSLLTLGIVVWDKAQGILYKREICQKLDKIVATKEALEINHFNISNYTLKDILSAEEINEEFKMLREKFFSNNKIPLAGHNIQFDFSFLKAMYDKSKLDYQNMFLHRLVDMFSILQFLIHLKRIPEEISNSTKAFEYFGIDVNGRHTALGDSVGAAELYERLLELMNK